MGIFGVTDFGLFCAAVLLLNATPGPDTAFIVGRSIAQGRQAGLVSALGISVGCCVHALVSALGLGAMLAASAVAFGAIKLAGGMYLIYLGVQTWRAPVVDLGVDLGAVAAVPRSARRMFGRAFLVGFTNPKVLLFYGAFFPQFIAPGRAVAPQIWVLCVTYVVITVVVDSGWTVGAAWARGALGAHGRLRNRVSGGLLVGAGVGLALARPR